MQLLSQWAQRHGVSVVALDELKGLLGAVTGAVPDDHAGHSEAWVQQQVRLTAARAGGLLWRNNSGACKDERGNMVRYGLCNESPQLNKKLKSSDLIGVTPVTVTPLMVGHQIGVFTAIEVKKPGWHLTPGDKRAQAQAAFGALVVSKGGIFTFAQSVEDYVTAVQR
ncbi:hypothetical protein X848_gp62 [Edwardsiella phage PEi21]|uniref:VRR-NUC domain-containing protein n=1 Tax=Edwardsiella phage PEi21 TaxID=1325372 RepID=N0DUB8_9CAUD|nr:hypothetical protein X848_gp62 [Edwardsiella phage PEi21]BAN16872.1 hypothetical protein [Edwardsiella phage PEi21]